MPELPEVETVARQLRPLIKGKKITKIEVIDQKLKSNSFKSLIGLKVKDVIRIGKEVILDFGSSRYFAVHLRMTGRLIAVNPKSKKALADFYYKTSLKHVRLKLYFGKNELHFVDPRRFGTVKLLTKIQESGIDPMSRSFTKKIFIDLLKGSKQPLKSWLMRQDKLVGIGNIYASEILFAASLNPEKRVDSLTSTQVNLLYQSIGKILKKAIKYCGTTFSDFQTTTGEVGSFQDFLKVYGRERKNCFRCKEPIIRLVQQQRSTFYCPRCQK